MPLSFLRVFQTLDPMSAYHGAYNWSLVAISVGIAILAAFVALSIGDRIAVASTQRGRLAWAGAGAISMGGGIWSMHFVGMLAFSLPCGVGYDLLQTMLSLIPGVLASGVALWIISQPNAGLARVALGAVLMGGGIGAMDYWGMAAMLPDALVRYNLVMVLVSGVVAIGLAYASLSVRSQLKATRIAGSAPTLTAASIMGCAIAGMHYTAMQASVFYPLPGAAVAAGSPQTALALSIAGFGVVIAVCTLAAAFAGEQREAAKRLREEMAHRKQVEQTAQVGGARLQAIFDAVVDAIVTIDANGIIQQWSIGARRIFGYEAEEVIGQNIIMLMPEPHRSRHAQYIGAFITTGAAKVIGSGRELTAIRKDGTEVPMELAVSEVKAEGERLFTGIMRDITDRKIAEQELVLARVQAEQANQAKSQFLATMSHEIRTPMNGVLGMAGLLATTPLNDQQNRLVSNLSRSGQALLTIINDILDFSKIEAGKLELAPVDFDPREVVAEVADLFAERCSALGLELVYFVAEDVPVRAHGDSARLRQVLVNLVGNAVKFTERGEILIKLTADAGVGAHDAILVFSVEDTGIGIEADKIDRVFKSFEKADNSMRRARGGTGLGLAISRQLVELMGGRIDVESEFGRGSHFHFTMRCDRVEGGEADSKVGRTIERPLKVLLTDTNMVSARILGQYLSAWNVEARVVHTLEQAGEALAWERFDALLLDVKGLGASAVEFGRAVVKTSGGPAPAVIFLIGMDKFMADESLLGAGAFALLNKPARPSELFECLTAVATRAETDGVARFFVKRAAVRSMAHFEARLLVAENNPVNQDVATGILEAMGCRIVTAPNGRIATELFAEDHFDLILMDCEMPEMDGLEATRRIRQIEAASDGNGRRTPIVALTAHALADIHQACDEAGMDDFLTKPFDERQINDALRRWIPHCEKAQAAPAVETTTELVAVEPTLAPHAAAQDPQPAEQEEAAAIDRSAFDKVAAFRGPNGAALLRKVVGKFQESAPVLSGTMSGSAGEGDIEALWRAAHSLKSSAAAVGAMRLSKRSAEIETLGRAGDLDALRPLLDGLEHDLSDALAGLAQLIEEPDVRVA